MADKLFEPDSPIPSPTLQLLHYTISCMDLDLYLYNTVGYVASPDSLCMVEMRGHGGGEEISARAEAERKSE